MAEVVHVAVTRLLFVCADGPSIVGGESPRGVLARNRGSRKEVATYGGKFST